MHRVPLLVQLQRDQDMKLALESLLWKKDNLERIRRNSGVQINMNKLKRMTAAMGVPFGP